MQKTALSGWTEEKERDEWGGEGKGRSLTEVYSAPVHYRPQSLIQRLHSPILQTDKQTQSFTWLKPSIPSSF